MSATFTSVAARSSPNGVPGHLFCPERRAVAKTRVGVYIDYSNVYSGARDAFMLWNEQGYKGNINPFFLARHVALSAPSGCADRSETHELTFAKVFRGAPDPGRDPIGAKIEAARAAQWEQWGCNVYRQTLDYGSGFPAEKGVDVRLATNLIVDQSSIDLAIVVSADKDFRYALLELRDQGQVDIEVSIWQAVPGGEALGRIELRPERSDEPEVDCHFLNLKDFGRFEDRINYKQVVDRA